MSLFSSLVGGAAGAELTLAVQHVIDQHGGLQGVVQQFESQGLGPTIKSWISTGSNLPISPAQIQQALGSDTVRQLAAKVGIDPQVLAQKLSEALPKAVDQMTPGGAMPLSAA